MKKMTVILCLTPRKSNITEIIFVVLSVDPKKVLKAIHIIHVHSVMNLNLFCNFNLVSLYNTSRKIMLYTRNKLNTNDEMYETVYMKSPLFVLTFIIWKMKKINMDINMNYKLSYYALIFINTLSKKCSSAKFIICRN